MGSRKDYFLWVGRQNKIIILTFRIGTSKNKKKTMTEVTYESDHISLLHDSATSSPLNFYFYLFYCNLKEKDLIRRNINSKKILICKISIIICQNQRRSGPYNKQLSCVRLSMNFRKELRFHNLRIINQDENVLDNAKQGMQVLYIKLGNMVMKFRVI